MTALDEESFAITASAEAAPAEWLTEYGPAREQAIADKKYLFILFEEPEKAGRFFPEPFKDSRHVFVRLPSDGDLRKHAAFRELASPTGIVILDYTVDETAERYGKVVGLLPEYKLGDSRNVTALLGLPAGTLTQRTFVWAVRTHPKRPQSTSSFADPELMDYSAEYASTMARMGVQEHYLLGRNRGVEIINETYPTSKGVVEAAEEMVHYWHDRYGGRREGHWGACMAPCERYAYDMAYSTKTRRWYGIGVLKHSAISR
jgi:hypothetical protein